LAAIIAQFGSEYNEDGRGMVGQFEIGRSRRLPAQKMGGGYENNRAEPMRFCSGRSVPGISGRIGQVSFQTTPLPIVSIGIQSE
jgi:hypothetical protein